MALIGNNTIGKRVMATIKARIDAAQKQYDTQAAKLEEKCEADKIQLDITLANDKENLAKLLVEGIVGK